MILFELKKIFERKLNVIAMIAGYLLIGVCLFSYLSRIKIYDEKTNTYMKGIEAIHYAQEKAASQTDFISEEYITSFIQDIQGQNKDFESDDEAYVKVLHHSGDMFHFTSKNYMEIGEQFIDRQCLNSVDLTNGAMFYEHRLKKVTDYMNMDFPYGNYSEAEKEYWIEKTKAVDVPFTWGYKAVMDIIWDTIMVSFYLLFVVIICISSVFSSEHESGAASLLLTTKYGKNRLITSKVVTAMLFTVGYIGIGLLVSIGAVGVLFGFPGADLPVQLWDAVIPFNLTAGQACMLSVGIVMLLGIAITSIQLLCSATFKSSIATLVIGFVILIVPVFFPMSRSSGLWNHINYLFPFKVIHVKDMLSSFISYPLGSRVIPYMSMVFIVYTIVAVLALIPIKKAFIRMK